MLRGGISRTFAAAACLVLVVPAEAVAGSSGATLFAETGVVVP